MATKSTTVTNSPEEAHVALGKKLREAHPWVDKLAQDIKERAIANRQNAERVRGPPLSSTRIKRIVNDLDKIQKQLNPLLEKREKLTAQLLSHWGHTQIEEIEGTTGKTLISKSFQLGIDPVIVKKRVSLDVWNRITHTVLDPKALLDMGETERKLTSDDTDQKIIGDAIIVKKMIVSVTPPCSRRPRSSESETDE